MLSRVLVANQGVPKTLCTVYVYCNVLFIKPMDLYPGELSGGGGGGGVLITGNLSRTGMPSGFLPPLHNSLAILRP